MFKTTNMTLKGHRYFSHSWRANKTKPDAPVIFKPRYIFFIRIKEVLFCSLVYSMNGLVSNFILGGVFLKPTNIRLSDLKIKHRKKIQSSSSFFCQKN